MIRQSALTGRTFSTSSIQREVIHAHGHSGSNQNCTSSTDSTDDSCSVMTAATRPRARLFHAVSGQLTIIFVPSEWERLLGVATGMVERLADQARQRIEEALTDLSANQAEGVWRQAERDLQEHYERLRESLRPMNVGWGHTVSGTTPEHPLGCHASFHLPAGYVVSDDGTLVTTVGNPEVPPVDVTVDFWQRGSQLRYTSEVSRR